MATKITCASLECEFRDDRTGRCKAKEISLSDHSVMTVHEGRQHFHRCKMFKESDEAREIRQRMEAIFKGKGIDPHAL